ncbi:MAG: cyclase [Streptosporangiales bacterium]|nr:cyclase [Streptosporangiales bacterium]
MADRTSSSTVIEAAQADVMAVIADFPAYPDWTGAVKSAEVLAEGPDGRATSVRLRLEAGPISDTYTLGYTWSGDDRVTWEIEEPGTMVTRLDGAYELTPAGEGRTEVTYELTVDLGVPMIGMLKRRAAKMIIDTALKGLKRRVEG